jgi:Mg-chelatase subunit ChlI
VVTKPIKNVQIPLSITEESLLGNMDVELLLKNGKQRFIPGILAKAHRQILYIDEVNLLPDHITDDILDVAAMGWNQIEREGFSLSHPSRFLLIGTMNPEEGELRPQILDRFPLSVNVSSVTDPAIRKEIIIRNLAYEKEPEKFCKKFQQTNENLKQQIKLSQIFLNQVQVKSELYNLVVDLCSEKNVDGHRADITIIKTAQTHAAFEMRDQVNLRHIKQAARFVLGHRTREGGLSKPLKMDEIDEYFANLAKGKLRTNKEKNNQKFSLFSQGDLIQPEKK